LADIDDPFVRYWRLSGNMPGPPTLIHQFPRRQYR